MVYGVVDISRFKGLEGEDACRQSVVRVLSYELPSTPMSQTSNIIIEKEEDKHGGIEVEINNFVRLFEESSLMDVDKDDEDVGFMRDRGCDGNYVACGWW